MSRGILLAAGLLLTIAGCRSAPGPARASDAEPAPSPSPAVAPATPAVPAPAADASQQAKPAAAAADPAPAAPLPLRTSLTDPLSDAEQRWIDRAVERLPLRERIAQLVMVWVLGDFTNAADPAYAQVERQIREMGIGGVVMSLGSPIEVAAKVNSMQRAALERDPAIPLLVSSDLEPGLGRLEGGVFVPSLLPAGSATVLPSSMAIGATGSERNARDAGRVTGREAVAIGIHLVFAPVADVNNNPANPVINIRSFGEDPAAVAGMVSAFVSGVQQAGAMATVKHFPGHGDTDTDSHHALPLVPANRAQLDTVELVPFRSAIASGVAGVMSAHIALPAVQDSVTPATLSPAVMDDLLRDELGFSGLAVTDALTMEGIGRGYTTEESAVLAVQAGSDVLLMPREVERTISGVEAAVRRGDISAERIEASLRRLLEWKVRTNAVARPITSLEETRRVVAAPEHLAAARGIAEESITLLRDEASLVPLRDNGAARIVAFVYAPESEITAGRAFLATLRENRDVVTHRITPAASAAQLDSLASTLRAGDDIVVTTHVRRIEGEGRTAVPPHVANWINSLARSRSAVVIAFGNPYVIRQFPSVSSYMVTFALAPSSEAAAARALAGSIPIRGRAPVSLPGFFSKGAGISRGGPE
ncbi:MAG TPA: glycoside hydrolase family 3 N-terminal domain-containing protein [Gemmatimonadales bacterium]|nr:glycoside hydrolase family 3 N-terminal domain-containing protein [Gemmatimonadales bacterium]